MPVWKSLTIWTRLAVIFSNKFASTDLVYFHFRVFSLVQTLLIISNNIKPGTFEGQTSFGFIVRIQEYCLQIMSFTFPSSSCLALFGILIIYFIMIIAIFFKALFFLTKKLIESRSLTIFTAILNFHAEVLFYPINNFLFKLYKILIHDQIMTYLSQKKIILSIVLLLVCLNTLVTFYNITFCYSRIRSSKYISRIGSLHLLGIASLKFFLPFFQEFVIHTKETANLIPYEMICVIISLIISCCVLFYTITVLPEYNLNINKIHLIWSCMALGISTGQMIGFLSETYEAIPISTVLIIPFCIKLNLNKFEGLLRSINHHPDKESNINHAVHLEVIYTQLEDDKSLSFTQKRFSLANLEAIKPKYNTIVATEAFEENNLTGSHLKSKYYLKKTLERLLDIKPNNILNLLTYSLFILKNFSLYSKSYHLCKKVHSQKLSVPDRISVFFIKCKIQEILQKEIEKHNSTSSSRVLWEQVNTEEAFQDFKSDISRYIEQSIKFWQIFKSNKPRIINLIREAKHIEEKRLRIEVKWKRYQPKFSQGFPLVYLLYGVVKTKFMNMPFEGLKYVNFCNSLIKKKLVDHNIETLEEYEYGTLMVSGEKEKLGKVLDCWGSIPNIFKRKKNSLTENNINLLMPKFFKEIHNQFILSHHETGRYNLLGKEKMLYGKDGNQNIFPILLTLGVSPNLEKGIVYLGLIKKIEDKNGYILFTEDGLIEEVSVGVGKLLSIQADKKTSIRSLFPHLIYSSPKLSSLQNDILSNRDDMPEQKNLKGKSNRLSIFSDLLNNSRENSFSFYTEITTLTYNQRILNVMTLRLKEKLSKTLLIPETITKEESTNYNTKYTELQPIDDLKIRNNSAKKVTFFERANFKNNFTSSNLDKTKVSNPYLLAKNRVIDNFQRILSKNQYHRFRARFLAIFFIIPLISLTLAGLHYLIFKDSSQDIDFAINSIRTSYDRLISLGWVWWFCVVYRTRIDKFSSTTEDELDRFKLLIRTNRQKMKTANDELMRVVGKGESDQQDQFFVKDITFVYDNNDDDSSTYHHERQLNSFGAINILVERLIKFDVTPHQIIFQSKNLDLEFVINNSMNDLLIASEKVVELIESALSHEIDKNTCLRHLVFFLNIGINFIGIITIGVIFYNAFQSERKIVQALKTIHEGTIDLIISELVSFQNLLKEESPILERGLNKTYSKGTLKKNFEQPKINRKGFQINGLRLLRLRQSCFLILLFACFSLGYSIGFISSDDLLEEVLKANNRTLITYKALYNCNMGVASLTYFIGSHNKTTITIRNQPIDIQIFKNINAVFTTEILFEAFTDKNGRFIDYSIEDLFKGKPCSLVFNYLRSHDPRDCLRATHNQSIGIFAVNSDYHNELYAIANEALANLTFETSKKILSLVDTTTAPKAITITGAYMFLIDLMSKKYDEAISNLLDDGIKKLIIELTIMGLMTIIVILVLLAKILNDQTHMLVLKIIPFEEISNNKFLRNVIQKLYPESKDLLNLNA